MNERIEALAKQAGMVMYPTGLGISENTLWGDRNIGKLADLIIQECARIARAVPCPYEDKEARDRLGHTWDIACVESGNSIIKHFGVK
ncbi:hypothetical protein GW796_00805 [archaeon]|nr:hypothetical protein [archaeon]NCQ50445.1 hypothetical protein [archaeon]